MRERLDNQLDPLVGNEPTAGQIKIPGGQRHRGRQHHRRRNNRRGATVVAANTSRHLTRVGHKGIHPRIRHRIPEPHVGEQEGQDRALNPRNLLASDIIAGAPGKAHRRMAIADVDGTGARDDPLRIGAAAADDQIVVTQIKTFKRAGVEQKVAPEVLAPAGETLHKRGADVPLPIVVGHHIGIIDRGKNRRIGVERVECLKDALGAAVLVQVIVDEGNTHNPDPWRQHDRSRARVALGNKLYRTTHRRRNPLLGCRYGSAIG